MQISLFVVANDVPERLDIIQAGWSTGGRGFLVLTKIGDNWPENERLWRIKRGYTAKHGFGYVCFAFLRYHKTSPRSVICNEYGSN